MTSGHEVASKTQDGGASQTTAKERKSTEAPSRLRDVIVRFLFAQENETGEWAILVREPGSTKMFVLKGTGTPQVAISDVKIFQRPDFPVPRPGHDAERNISTWCQALGEMEERRYHYEPSMAAASFPEGMLEPQPPIPGRDLTLQLHPKPEVVQTRVFEEPEINLVGIIQQLTGLLERENPTFYPLPASRHN